MQSLLKERGYNNSLTLKKGERGLTFEKGELKSDGQEKSTKILISWQELKNQFLSFFVHR